jgi:hypothetical protein
MLRDLLHARLPKVARPEPSSPYVGFNPTASAVAQRSQDAFTMSPERAELMAQTAARRMAAPKAKRASRAGGERFNKVRMRVGGSWPRAGTARAAKTTVVRDKLMALDGVCLASRLLGLLYTDPKGKTGRITYHDLEVMADKGLLTLGDNA